MLLIINDIITFHYFVSIFRSIFIQSAISFKYNYDNLWLSIETVNFFLTNKYIILISK